MLKIYWLNEELSSVTNLSATGALSSHRYTVVSNANIKVSVIPFSWMKYLSKLGGVQHYLWRAVDQDGEVVDVFSKKSCNATAAKRFFKRLFKTNKGKLRKIVTDKLASYGVAHRELSPDVIHDNKPVCKQPFGTFSPAYSSSWRVMRRFKSQNQAQRFLDSYSAVFNQFNLQRHYIPAEHYRRLRTSAFTEWNCVVA